MEAKYLTLKQLYEEKAQSSEIYQAFLGLLEKEQIKTLDGLEALLRRDDFSQKLNESYLKKFDQPFPEGQDIELKKVVLKNIHASTKQVAANAEPVPLYTFSFYPPCDKFGEEYAQIAGRFDQIPFKKLLSLEGLYNRLGNNLPLLGSYTIQHIKEQLGITSSSALGGNGIRDLLGGRTKFAPSNVARIIDLLDFWDEVVRYKIELGEIYDYSLNGSYTLLSSTSKREEWIRNQLNDILKYLKENFTRGEPNIWGISTVANMERLENLINSKKTLTATQKDQYDTFIKSLALFLTDSDFDINGKLVAERKAPILREDGSIVFENRHPLYGFSSDAVNRRRLVRENLKKN